MPLENQKSKIKNGEWLPDMDLNHDKQIQSLLCYRYTIGQSGVLSKLKSFADQSSCQSRKALPSPRLNLWDSVRLSIPKGFKNGIHGTIICRKSSASF